ncbi:hypothetical protein EB093_07965 [bacterium]|nr:hypothetical protein [bacterium]
MSSSSQPIDVKSCIHDIRNYKQLSSKQNEYVKQLSSEDKQEIIYTYQLVVASLVSAIENS